MNPVHSQRRAPIRPTYFEQWVENVQHRYGPPPPAQLPQEFGTTIPDMPLVPIEQMIHTIHRARYHTEQEFMQANPGISFRTTMGWQPITYPLDNHPNPWFWVRVTPHVEGAARVPLNTNPFYDTVTIVNQNSPEMLREMRQ